MPPAMRYALFFPITPGTDPDSDVTWIDIMSDDPGVFELIRATCDGAHAYHANAVDLLLALRPEPEALARLFLVAPNSVKPKIWKAFSAEPRGTRLLAWLLNYARAPYRERVALLLAERYPEKRELLVGVARFVDKLYAEASAHHRAT